MSRSKKGKRSPGSEYWSKRPVSRNHGAIPGKVTKKITAKKERAEAKRDKDCGCWDSPGEHWRCEAHGGPGWI